jgi:hypothetical protein
MPLSNIDLLNVKTELTSELLTSLALTAPLKFKTAVYACALTERTAIITVPAVINTLRMDENFIFTSIQITRVFATPGLSD